MDWHGFLDEWQREAAGQGFVNETLVELGGHLLVASWKGERSKPCVYLSAGVHGDEPAGPLALLKLLRGGFFDDRFHWLICPLINPTGSEMGSRENREGIDLNRDYCRCASAEVSAHIGWLRRQVLPQLFLSLHEDWESSGFYFYEINLGDEGCDHAGILAAAAGCFGPEPEAVIDGHEVTERGWIYHSEHPDLPEGWPEAIFLAKLGCPLSFTFETPSSAELERRVACHEAVVKEALRQVALL